MIPGRASRWRSGRALLVATAVITVVFATGFSAKSPVARHQAVRAVATPHAGGSLTISFPAAITSLDPASSGFALSPAILGSAIYDPLLVAQGSTFVPYLAQSLNPSTNLQTYTLVLRPNVDFSDGTPLNAQAVVFNFTRFRNPGICEVCLTSIGDIASVTASGPLTVVFQLKQPSAGFPYLLSAASVESYIASPTAVQREGANYGMQPVGAGPFVVTSFSTGNQVSLSKNPHYWQPGKPYLNHLAFRTISDDQSAYETLQTGAIEMMQPLGTQVLAQARSNSSVSVLMGSGPVAALAFNVGEAPFNDPVAREAVVAAINREQVHTLADDGLSQIYNGVFPPGSPNYTVTGYPTYSPSRAKQLLRQYGKPLSFTFVGSSGAGPARLYQVLQAQLATVGITMKIQTVDPSALIPVLLGHQFQVTENELLTGTSANPGLMLAEFFQSTSIANFGNFKSPTVDALLATADQSTDPATRTRAWQSFDREIAKELPYAYLTASDAPYSLVATKSVHIHGPINLGGSVFHWSDVSLGS